MTASDRGEESLLPTPKDEAQFRDAFAQLDDDLQVRLLQSLGPASAAGVESREAPGRSRIHQQVFTSARAPAFPCMTMGGVMANSFCHWFD